VRVFRRLKLQAMLPGSIKKRFGSLFVWLVTAYYFCAISMAPMCLVRSHPRCYCADRSECTSPNRSNHILGVRHADDPSLLRGDRICGGALDFQASTGPGSRSSNAFSHFRPAVTGDWHWARVPLRFHFVLARPFPIAQKTDAPTLPSLSAIGYRSSIQLRCDPQIYKEDRCLELRFASGGCIPLFRGLVSGSGRGSARRCGPNSARKARTRPARH